MANGRARLIALFLICATAARADESVLNVTVSKQATTDVIRVVDRIGRADRKILDAYHTFASVVRERCGILDAAYVELFLDLNKAKGLKPEDLLTLSHTETYDYPACLGQPGFKVVELKPKDDVGKIYKRNGIILDSNGLEARWTALHDEEPLVDLVAVLAKGKALAPNQIEGHRAVENARRFVLANSEVKSFRDMQTGMKIKVPIADTAVTLVLKPSERAADARQRLDMALAKNNGGDAAMAKPADLINDYAGPLDAAACPAASDIWPIDTKAYIAALGEAAKLRPTGNDKIPPTATVMVLDTGSDEIEAWKATFGDAAIGEMLGVNTTEGDQHFTDVNLAANINNGRAPDDLKHRLHGVWVASVIQGSWLPPEQRKKIANRLKVTFASVAVEDADGEMFLSAGAIQQSLPQAHYSELAIVNASLAADADSTGFLANLNEFNDVLFITAAGNSEGPFAPGDLPWPGAFGGDQIYAGKGSVISVGAHGFTKKILPFSRRGENRVDVLAPGCNIPVVAPSTKGDNWKELNGTSFAAALVSHLAGLLYTDGLRTPAAIKQRILVGVDVDNDLENLVYARGYLNVRKALAIRRDYLEFADMDHPEITRTLIGEVLNRSDYITACNEQFAIGDLLKLAEAGAADKARAHVWLKTAAKQGAAKDKIKRLGLCPLTDVSGADIEFRDDADRTGPAVVVPVDRVRDLIMKSFNF